MANINMSFGKPVIVSRRLFRGRDHVWHLVKYNGDVAIYAKCKCGFHFPSMMPKIFGGDDRVKTYSYCPVCGAKKKRFTDNVEIINKFAWED